MATVRAGLAGGVIATIGMTMSMLVMGDGGPPPTAQVVSTFAGGDPDDYAMPGIVLHILYCIGAGVVFVVGVPYLGLSSARSGVAWRSVSSTRNRPHDRWDGLLDANGHRN